MTKLEAERRRRGWTQMDVGFHARLSQGEISRFERGRAVPFPAQAERLAHVLGLTPRELLDVSPLAPEGDIEASLRHTEMK